MVLSPSSAAPAFGSRGCLRFEGVISSLSLSPFGWDVETKHTTSSSAAGAAAVAFLFYRGDEERNTTNHNHHHLVLFSEALFRVLCRFCLLSSKRRKGDNEVHSHGVLSMCSMEEGGKGGKGLEEKKEEIDKINKKKKRFSGRRRFGGAIFSVGGEEEIGVLQPILPQFF